MYRDAALQRNADDPEIRSAIIRSEEAFDDYRAAECDAQSAHWEFMRAMRRSICQRRLTDGRSRVIWRHWLYPTAVFETHLPEPQANPSD